MTSLLSWSRTHLWTLLYLCVIATTDLVVNLLEIFR